MINENQYKHCIDCGTTNKRLNVPRCYECYKKTQKQIEQTSVKTKKYGHKKETKEDGFYHFDNPYINGFGIIILTGWIGSIWINWSWYAGIIACALYWSTQNETFIYKMLHNKQSNEQISQWKEKKKDKQFQKNTGLETYKEEK